MPIRFALRWVKVKISEWEEANRYRAKLFEKPARATGRGHKSGYEQIPKLVYWCSRGRSGSDISRIVMAGGFVIAFSARVRFRPGLKQ